MVLVYDIFVCMVVLMTEAFVGGKVQLFTCEPLFPVGEAFFFYVVVLVLPIPVVVELWEPLIEWRSDVLMC